MLEPQAWVDAATLLLNLPSEIPPPSLCLASLGDSQLSKVWSNAEALDVLDKEARIGEFSTLNSAAAREKYTHYIVLLNADSQDTTLRLNLHRQYVCGLAGR